MPSKREFFTPSSRRRGHTAAASREMGRHQHWARGRGNEGKHELETFLWFLRERPGRSGQQT